MASSVASPWPSELLPPPTHRKISARWSGRDHFAARSAGSYAIAIDPSAKLHFSKPDVGGDHVVAVLGHDVADCHLAELVGDGVSYIVAPEAQPDLAGVLEVLGRDSRSGGSCWKEVQRSMVRSWLRAWSMSSVC